MPPIARSRPATTDRPVALDAGAVGGPAIAIERSSSMDLFLTLLSGVAWTVVYVEIIRVGAIWHNQSPSQKVLVVEGGQQLGTVELFDPPRIPTVRSASA